jgi:hypothetical protein
VKRQYEELHAWPAPRDPVVEIALRLIRFLSRMAVAVARGVARAARTAVPAGSPRRLSRRLVPIAVSVGAMGFVAVGLHVGNARPAGNRTTTVRLAGNSFLRGADTAPPVAAKKVPDTTVVAPAPIAPAAPELRGALPVGKGMWLYQPKAVEGGNAAALVARAKLVGLTHVFVRTGSSKVGFNAAEYLNQLLPVAHANGIRVYGWDFPYLDVVGDDVTRAVQAITYTTPDGHRIDGFSADIEFPSMGVKVTPENATAYGAGLRQWVGPNYPLIATVPRPSPKIKFYPYPEVVASFDAIAPMVYWLNREPVSDVVGAVRDLAKFNKPVIPIGQAYDGAADHGPPGVPGRAALFAFMDAAEKAGVTSVSFWSWQHASQEAWDAIKDAPQFTLPAGPVAAYTPGQIRAYQYLLNSLGFPTAIDGAWSEATAASVVAYQTAAHLPVTGVIDEATKQLLLHPFRIPLLGQLLGK